MNLSVHSVLLIFGLLLSFVLLAIIGWSITFAAYLEPVWAMPDADPIRGRQAIIRHGCGACHVIPNIRSATGRVGPQLLGLSEQIYIAGRLPNTPDNLIAWIRDPQAISPATAMPTLPVTEQEARDIAAYLLRGRPPRTLTAPTRHAAAHPFPPTSHSLQSAHADAATP